MKRKSTNSRNDTSLKWSKCQNLETRQKNKNRKGKKDLVILENFLLQSTLSSENIHVLLETIQNHANIQNFLPKIENYIITKIINIDEDLWNRIIDVLLCITNISEKNFKVLNEKIMNCLIHGIKFMFDLYNIPSDISEYSHDEVNVKLNSIHDGILFCYFSTYYFDKIVNESQKYKFVFHEKLIRLYLIILDSPFVDEIVILKYSTMDFLSNILTKTNIKTESMFIICDSIVNLNNHCFTKMDCLKLLNVTYRFAKISIFYGHILTKLFESSINPMKTLLDNKYLEPVLLSIVHFMKYHHVTTEFIESNIQHIIEIKKVADLAILKFDSLRIRQLYFIFCKSYEDYYDKHCKNVDLSNVNCTYESEQESDDVMIEEIIVDKSQKTDSFVNETIVEDMPNTEALQKVEADKSVVNESVKSYSEEDPSDEQLNSDCNDNMEVLVSNENVAISKSLTEEHFNICKDSKVVKSIISYIDEVCKDFVRPNHEIQSSTIECNLQSDDEDDITSKLDSLLEDIFKS